MKTKLFHKNQQIVPPLYLFFTLFLLIYVLSIFASSFSFSLIYYLKKRICMIKKSKQKKNINQKIVI